METEKDWVLYSPNWYNAVWLIVFGKRDAVSGETDDCKEFNQTLCTLFPRCVLVCVYVCGQTTNTQTNDKNAIR